MRQTFYSNGKLLITGEYIVLDGAKALALPTKFGQDLVVEPGQNRQIYWQSFDSDGSVWFEDTIGFDEISGANYVQKTDSVRSTLIEILHEAYLINPSFTESSEGYVIATHLTFPKFWGLGTSSTLINNIAQWLSIDAFELLRNSFGGSGYDIACAQRNTPIVYHLENEMPKIEAVECTPVFADDLYFVYLNKKQSSKAAIASYYNNRLENLDDTILAINRITDAVLHAGSLRSFGHALEDHEAIISRVIEMKTVKETFFPDFNGSIKSLGGWGGDFILAASEENPTEYFSSRGFKTVVPYREMIL
ncbi:MAG TPA: GYDIA family GHMP kinase [Flavobacterium sp.]|jgi:mevalonate kinase